jgi:hypothetical protein
MENIKVVQNQVSLLAGVGVSVGNTSMTLQSFVDLKGNPLTMANFGIVGNGTMQPGEQGYEEPISWTGIVQNSDGTATLTGIESVLGVYPNTGTSGFSLNHGWGTNFVVSNTSGFFSTWANTQNSETIGAPWVFAAEAENANPKIDSNSYAFTSLDYITLGAVQTILGAYLLTNGTNEMLAPLNMDGHLINNVENPVSPQDAATKIYVDNSIAAGGVPANVGTQGLVNIATQAQFNAGTNTEVIGGLTYYNMPTISMVKSVGSFNFVYGENITALNYVFQATGLETKTNSANSLTSPGPNITASTNWFGGVLIPYATASNIQSITISNQRVSGSVSGNIVLKIYALSGGLPTGAALGTSNASSIIGAGAWTNVTYTFATPVVITPGTSYACVIDTAGLTFSAGVIVFGASVGTTAFVSTNSGGSYSSVSYDLAYVLNQGLTAGKVYNVDSSTISNVGNYQYKGIALNTDTSGDTNSIQLSNVVPGFSSLLPGQNVYINPSVPGGLTQTAGGAGTNRIIGLAVSATQIQLIPPYTLI